MPPTHTDEGLRAALQIRAEEPGTAVLVLSQYVEEAYAFDLLSESSESTGYLLKDRIADVATFTDAVRRVANGGTALDPEVVALLLGRSRRADPLAVLTPREREVLALMAEGRSNAAMAQALVVTERAVEKHVTAIFSKLDLPPAVDDHRRVLAVLVSALRLADDRRRDPTRAAGVRRQAPGRGPFWREALAPYGEPDTAARCWTLPRRWCPTWRCRSSCTSRSTSPTCSSLALAVPAAGFLLRTYILFHDCAHGSFLPSQAGEHVAGQGARADRLRAVRAAGATATRCTTRPPATSTGAASATCPR